MTHLQHVINGMIRCIVAYELFQQGRKEPSSRLTDMKAEPLYKMGPDELPFQLRTRIESATAKYPDRRSIMEYIARHAEILKPYADALAPLDPATKEFVRSTLYAFSANLVALLSLYQGKAMKIDYFRESGILKGCNRNNPKNTEKASAEASLTQSGVKIEQHILAAIGVNRHVSETDLSQTIMAICDNHQRERKYPELESAHAAAIEEARRLESAHAAAIEEARRLESARAAASEETKRLESAHAAASEETRKLEALLQERQAAHEAELARIHAMYERKLAEAESSMGSLKASLQSTQETAGTLKTDLESAQETISSLRTTIAGKEETILTQRQETETLKATREQLTSQLSASSKEIAQKEALITQLETTGSDLRSEVEYLKRTTSTYPTRRFFPSIPYVSPSSRVIDPPSPFMAGFPPD